MIKKKIRKELAKLSYKISGGGFNPKKPEFRILVYHSITDNSDELDSGESMTPNVLFDEHMKYLRANSYNVIHAIKALEYLLNKERMPPKSVCITFDDGFRDNYLNALPILKKYGLPATFFITLNLLRDYSGDNRFLNKEEVGRIANEGVFDFGCHGLTHDPLAGLTEARLEEEISGAKRGLEAIINRPLRLFAYPFGHNKSFDKNTLAGLKKYGFLGAATAIFGSNNMGTDPFLLKRNRISWIDDIGEFEKHLSGAYDWYAIYQYLAPKRYSF